MDGRRERYRETQQRPFLRAKLEVLGVASAEGQVVDLSAGGAGVLLPKAKAASMRVGLGACLLFETLVLLKPIRLSARIACTVEEADGRVRVGLEFTRPGELDRQVPFVLRKEFNRRADPRARPEDPIDVLVASPDGSEKARARMVDVSTGGLGVSLSAGDAGKFATAEKLSLAFHLPGSSTELHFAGKVRGRRAQGDLTLLNVQFDARATEDYEWQRSIVEEYVTERLVRSRELRSA